MGGEQAASVLATVHRDADKWTPEQAEAFKQPIRDDYEAQGNPWHATARLWDDGIIDPAQTRDVLGLAFAAMPECADPRAAAVRRVQDVMAMHDVFSMLLRRLPRKHCRRPRRFLRLRSTLRPSLAPINAAVRGIRGRRCCGNAASGLSGRPCHGDRNVELAAAVFASRAGLSSPSA